MDASDAGDMTDYSAMIAALSVEVGDCVEWTGHFGNGRTSCTPIIKRRHNGRRVTLIVARLVWTGANGPIQPGRIVYRHCCNDRCVRLDHLRCGRRGDQHRRRAALGLAGHMQSTRAAITTAARNRAKYTARQVARVRELAVAGVRDKQISADTGVGLAMVADIRSGRAWSAALPAASVFAWRPAA